MKKLIAALFAGLLSGIAMFPQTMKTEQSAEEAVKAIELELSNALVKGDATAVERILADDFVEITPLGALVNKADVMSVVRARASAPRGVMAGPEVTVENAKFTVYGEVVVYVGVTTTRYQHMQHQVPNPGSRTAPDSIHRERFMKLYTKRGGVWRLVASQSTPLVSQ